MTYVEAQSDRFDALVAAGKFKPYRQAHSVPTAPAPAAPTPAAAAIDAEDVAQRVFAMMQAKQGSRPDSAASPSLDVDAVAQRVLSLLEPKLETMLDATASRIMSSIVAATHAPPPLIFPQGNISRPTAAEQRPAPALAAGPSAAATAASKDDRPVEDDALQPMDPLHLELPFMDEPVATHPRQGGVQDDVPEIARNRGAASTAGAPLNVSPPHTQCTGQ